MGYSVTLLRNGFFRLDAGSMFGLIPKTVWERWVEVDEQNRMTLQQNSLLLESSDGELVLIEAGIGDKFGDKERAMYGLGEDWRGVHESVREADRDPADIGAVVLTHLHFDHAGGLTTFGEGGSIDLAFPNARIIVQEREWQDAIANKSTMTKTYLKEHLTPEVADRLDVIGEDEPDEVEVMPGLRVIRTPGHTWGQQSVVFDCVGCGAEGMPEGIAGRRLCFVSDVMPTRWHSRPTTNLAYDVEAYTSMVARQKLMQRASDEGWAVMPNHDPSPSPFFTIEPDAENPRRWRVDPVA